MLSYHSLAVVNPRPGMEAAALRGTLHISAQWWWRPQEPPHADAMLQRESRL
ncbi:MAG: hypothetical protein QM534_10560 [Sediminibacterium sp.]|nr:hypothetical protein [Sediminibacterium sp.]